MPKVIELSELPSNSRNGFQFQGIVRGAQVCHSVGNAGDVNNDGIGDLIVSGPMQPDTPGTAAVIFGEDRGAFNSIQQGLNGNNGFFIEGEPNDALGLSLNGVGDFNNDGFADVMVGAPGAVTNMTESVPGASHIVFGQPNGFQLEPDGEDSFFSVKNIDGTNGVSFPGIMNDERSGFSVSGLGDVNGDDVDDVIIGAPLANDGTGRAYVIFGDNAFNSTFDLNMLNGTNGFVINGALPGENLGSGVSYAGDLNNDGINDIITHNFILDNQNTFPLDEVGENIYVVYGKTSGFEPSMRVTELNGDNGFVVHVGSILGTVFSSITATGVGDVTGDGIDDFVIGVPTPELEFGEAYIIKGRNTPFPNTIHLDTLSGDEGVSISGPSRSGSDLTGSAITFGGDMNGDGIRDFLVGAPGVGAIPPNGDTASGQVFAVFGREDFNATFRLPSSTQAEGFTVNGSFFGDRIGRALTSVDINNDGLPDTVIGAPKAAVRRFLEQRQITNDLPEGVCFVVFSNAAPEIENNQFVIPRGDTVSITPSELSATDLNDLPENIQFFTTDPESGFFQNINDPDTPITGFGQQDITDGLIEFVHDGSNVLPAFSITANDGRDNSTVVPANIEFRIPSSSDNNTGAIIGGTIGGVAGAALILAAGVGALWYRRHQQKKDMPETERAARKTERSQTTELELGDPTTLTQSLLSNTGR